MCDSCGFDSSIKPLRACTKCGKEFEESDYDIRGNGTGRHFWVSRCLQCRLIHSRESNKAWRNKYPDRNKLSHIKWRQKNAEYRKYYHRKRDLQRHYGLTIEEYDDIMRLQGGVCAICNSPKMDDPRKSNLNVDHDHITGKVRGILCDKCNRLLGCARDSIEILESAIEYLKTQLVLGPGCDSCGCRLPSALHQDRRNLIHSRVIKGDITQKEYSDATKTRVGPNLVSQVKKNINRTERLINSGKLDPKKKHK